MSTNIKIKLKNQADSAYADSVSSRKNQTITLKEQNKYTGSAQKTATLKVTSTHGASASAQVKINPRSIKPSVPTTINLTRTGSSYTVNIGSNNATKVWVQRSVGVFNAITVKAGSISDTASGSDVLSEITNPFTGAAGTISIQCTKAAALNSTYFDTPEGNSILALIVKLTFPDGSTTVTQIYGNIPADTSVDYVWDPATNQYVGVGDNYVSAT